MGPVVRQGTEIALTRLLDLSAPDSPALDPRAQRFYRRIGTFESKQGRTLEAVLSAYRIGARVAWENMSATAVACEVDTAELVSLAEAIFVYIDELSAASAQGHSSGGVARRVAIPPGTGTARWQGPHRPSRSAGGRRRRGLGVARAVGRGRGPDRVRTRTHRPQDVLALVEGQKPWRSCPTRRAQGADKPWNVHGRDRRCSWAQSGRRPRLPSHWRMPEAGAATGGAGQGAGHPGRGRGGPSGRIPSPRLTPNCWQNLHPGSPPLADLKPAKREALEQTLSAWLAFQGDRQRIAEYLHVHPQTVSYRHQRLRELFGDALQDPHERLALQLVLGLPPTT